MTSDRINTMIAYCFERSLEDTENPERSLAYLNLALRWSEVGHIMAEWREYYEED